MTEYRRLYVPEEIYFFTAVAHNRIDWFTDSSARDSLQIAIAHVRKKKDKDGSNSATHPTSMFFQSSSMQMLAA